MQAVTAHLPIGEGIAAPLICVDAAFAKTFVIGT